MIGKDAQGNYQAYLPAGQDYTGYRVGTLWHKDGAPSDSFASNGDMFVNDATGAVYRKISGSWGLVASGGGGGVSHVIVGSFDNPNGHVSPDDPSVGAFYYKDSSSQTVVWTWSVEDGVWYQQLG